LRLKKLLLVYSLTSTHFDGGAKGMRNQFTGISGLSEYLIVITTVVETGTYTSIV